MRISASHLLTIRRHVSFRIRKYLLRNIVTTTRSLIRFPPPPFAIFASRLPTTTNDLRGRGLQSASFH